VRQADGSLRLSLYPGADGSFRLHDGTHLAWREQEASLLVEGSPVARQVSASIVGRRAVVRQVLGPDGEPVEWAALDLAGRATDARIAVGGTGTYRVHWEWSV